MKRYLAASIWFLILIQSAGAQRPNAKAGPGVPEAERALSYAACYLLRPKAERFAPHLVPHLAAAMRRLSGALPPEVTGESAFDNLKEPAAKDAEAELSEIEKLPTEAGRDAPYLSLVFTLWHQGDYRRARQVAFRLSNAATRQQLSTLIEFGEGGHLLERGDIARAEAIADRLPEGLERSMLRLGIAHAYAEKGNTKRAIESIRTALAAARKVSDARQPFLLLGGAGQLAKLDRSFAQLTLTEAVQAFNRQTPLALSEIFWQQRVEAGILWRDFPLRVQGLGFGFEQALPALAANDLEDTIMTVGGLTDEGQQAQAMLALASIILK